MTLAAALFLGHLIADFPLQTNWIYYYKTQSWVGVFLHCVIHLLVTAWLIQPLETAILPLLILGILHFLTDLTKVHIPTKRQSLGFLLDQFVHVGTIILISILWQETLSATLPFRLVILLISYVSGLSLMTFLWILASDLRNSRWQHNCVVQWSSQHLLALTQYAGLSLLLFIARLAIRSIQSATNHHKLLRTYPENRL